VEQGFAKRRKDLALEMAQLLYDIYREEADIIKNGQNNEHENSEE
jgi:hypothetical protein